MGRRIALVLAVALIILALPPWRGGFVDHPHWSRVAWLPFVSPPVIATDIVRNVLLFLPLGAAIAANRRSRPVHYAAAIALLMSLAGELAQLYSHTRFPSATDVTVNVGAAAAAAWFVSHHSTSRLQNRSRPF
jgi:glycopeptide antibiotics resistance protein